MEIYVLNEDPRAWEAIGHSPDDDVVQDYANVRTFLSRWHYWFGDSFGWCPIRHFPEYSDVDIDDDVTVRAYGRIITSDGEDITDRLVDPPRT